MRLLPNELCPLHRRRDCCGREAELGPVNIRPHGRGGSRGGWHGSTRWETVRIGVTRIRDEHARHTDGYRYRLSKGEMRKVLLQKIKEQNGLCSICGNPFVDIADIVPDHHDPRGMGGGWRDDRPENIEAAHGLCNLKKGSKRC